MLKVLATIGPNSDNNNEKQQMLPFVWTISVVFLQQTVTKNIDGTVISGY
jgi:hypothetical protein